MNNPLYNLRRWVHGLAGWHPSYEELLASRDGELGGWRRWRISSHRERCPACQKQSALLEEDLGLLQHLDRATDTRSLPDLPEGLVTLRQAIARWEILNQPGDEAREPVARAEEAWQQDLASELSVYLGTHAQDILLLRLRGQEPERNLLLAEAESLLCDFFGPRAAAAIARKILYAQTLRGAGAESFLAI